MIKTTLKIDGMMCGMCESHVNDAIRKAFPAVKKVTSSHGKGETVVISEDPLDEAQVKAAIAATGYDFKGMSRAVSEEAFPFLLMASFAQQKAGLSPAWR